MSQNCVIGEQDQKREDPARARIESLDQAVSVAVAETDQHLIQLCLQDWVRCTATHQVATPSYDQRPSGPGSPL